VHSFDKEMLFSGGEAIEFNAEHQDSGNLY
jgi:hypothetical protein